MGGGAWSLPRVPGYLLLGLGWLLALPAAIGVGAFGAERSLALAGAEEGLDEDTQALVRFARLVRGAALTAPRGVALPPGVAGPSGPPRLAHGGGHRERPSRTHVERGFGGEARTARAGRTPGAGVVEERATARDRGGVAWR